jgi:hypothetical protein
MEWKLLKIEIDTDPLAVGYSSMTDVQVATSLNVVNRSVSRTAVSGSDVFTAIKPADFLDINNSAHRWVLGILFGLDFVQLDSANVRTILTSIFAGKTDTLNAIISLQDEPVSRGVEIGFGKVHEGHVAHVRSL